MTQFYIYWISTSLLSLLYLASATLYVAKPEFARDGLRNLGYPEYLRPLMIGVKILGVLAIVWRVNVPLSDLAYAGMFYHLALAALAHAAVRKPQEALPALIGVGLVVASFMTQNGARDPLSPYAPLFGG